MKALIVDDEPHVIAVAKLLVDWDKYQIDQVFSCGDSLEALERIRAERPAVIISDIRMPGLDGLSLIEKVKEIDPSIRTILISAYSDFSYAQKAIGLGCVDYLLKPLTEEGLNQAVAKAVAQYNAERARVTQPLLHQAQNLLSRLLDGGSRSTWEELTQAAPFLAHIQQGRIGLIHTREFSLTDADRYQLCTYIHQFFYQKSLGIAALGDDSRDILLFLLADPRVPEACEELSGQLEKEKGLRISYGLSSPADFPEGWEKAYIEARKAASTDPEADTLRQIHKYIEDCYAKPLSLDFLADHFALSPTYLSRSFKKRYGIGLVDFITQVRIEKAKQLMLSSPLLLAEIASRVGIPDPKYFSRVFKRVTGLSPAEFRSQGGSGS